MPEEVVGAWATSPGEKSPNGGGIDATGFHDGVPTATPPHGLMACTYDQETAPTIQPPPAGPARAADEENALLAAGAALLTIADTLPSEVWVQR